jgi:hypothetical protein
VGVAALVPYFRFEADTASKDKRISEMAAKSEDFPLATRSAVEYYDHLRCHQDWDFDAVYWIGDSSLINVDYDAGGPGQENPNHFVELLAALAAVEFFRNPVTTKACYYAGPRQNDEPERGDENMLDWVDLPLRSDRQWLQARLLQFYLAGAAHLGFFHPLFRDYNLDQRPYHVPWYQDRITSRRHSLYTADNQRALQALTQFFAHFHYVWWSQIHARDGNARLFNRAALRPGSDGSMEPQLDHLGNLLWPDRPGEASLDRFDGFFTDTVLVERSKGGEEGAAAYFSLVAHAAIRYIEREYRMPVSKEVSRA